MPSPILRIAIPTPLYRLFDYLAPPHQRAQDHSPGLRVRVPFGRKELIGFLEGQYAESELPRSRLRAAHALLDETPVFTPDLWEMLHWAAEYYRHPLGEVLSGALPGLLRQGGQPGVSGERVWRLSELGARIDPASLGRAPRQAQTLQRLASRPEGLPREALGVEASVLRTLVAKGWLVVDERPCLGEVAGAGEPGPVPESQQVAAVDAIVAALGRFIPFLLEGVTGSGKTEVYLRLIEQVLARGEQALVLVPEIGLTPQLVRRFQRRLAVPLAILHSGLSDRERLCAWDSARQGSAPVVIGTRSAIFTPLARPGLILVDEEHDLSFKQQEGFRYSARDLAVWRARRLDVPLVLGSATPSLESLHNARRGRYRHLRLAERAGGASAPRVRLLDLRRQPMESPLSPVLVAEIDRHLEAGGQVLLFLNRRGFAPTLLCHDCGWVASCSRCDAHMTLHQRDRRLRCHHCGHERGVDPQCPGCGSADLRPLGKGTERIEETLGELFPSVEVVRIDRDTTRRKGELESRLRRARAAGGRILVGTQMLAKGHHFPDVTLVAIVDADQGLFSQDFRGAERLAQLVVQVAGRAGRAQRPGEVLIQTHHPDHPLWEPLLREGYEAFAEAELAEREAAALPPFCSIALLRAEAVQREAVHRFLEAALELARPAAEEVIEFWGPVPAPMERRAGRHRGQLLIHAPERAALQRLLSGWVPQLETLKSARRVRWSLDVDPLEIL